MCRSRVPDDIEANHFCDGDVKKAIDLKDDLGPFGTDLMTDAECMAKCAAVTRPAGEEYCCEHWKIAFMGDRSFRCILYPLGIGKVEGSKPIGFGSTSAGMCTAGVV